MLKEVSCTPSASPDCGSPVETKPGTPHFFIDATFTLTSELMDNNVENSMTKVASILFVTEQHAVLQDCSTISNLLNSSVGLPLQDCLGIAEQILSCARHDLPQGECLWMKLCVSCHLENPDEVEAVKHARNRTFDCMALKHVNVEQGAGAEVEVEVVEEIPMKRCSICLEDMVPGTKVTRIPCSHIFHDSCIMRWLERGANCPECRYDPIISTFGENNKIISHVFPDN